MPQAAAAAVFQVAGWIATNLGASSVMALKVASVAVKVSATVAKVALLAGANAVIANQNKPRPQGGMVNLTLSPNEPRRLQIGQRIHAGVLADWYVTAARNSHLFLIVYLGEGPMGALKKVYAGGRVVYSTPIAHGVRTAIPDFRSGGDRLWITYYDGRPGQTADSTLVGRSVGWTSNHVGTGCAYAIIEAHWDSDVLTSPPAFSFETEGAKLYDRRKDTTAGGSGSHRLDDPSTWEVSANPAVALDHFLLGRYLGSIKTFGIGLDPDEVPYAKFAALASLCDEDVDLSSSGTQKRYEANGFLFADRSYADTIRDLCRAMNARPADFGGQVGIIDGEEKTPVLTLYDADLIENVPEQYAPKRSWGELVNTVLGTYQNPAQLYQATEYPRITDAAWVTEDGGSVKEDNLDFEMEVSAERAQRLAWLHAKRQRRQATLVGAYKLRAIELEQGDWFIRSGSAFGEEGKVFEVVDRILDPATFIVTINAFEVDPADTAWTTDIPSDPPADPTPDTSELVAMEVPDLTVTAETLTGTAAQLPAIVVEWAAPDDPRVRQIMVEAVPAAGGVPMSAVAEVGTTQIVFTNGITDDTDYLVRARFLGTFSPSEWTSNFEITTEGDYAVGAASSVPWSGLTGTIPATVDNTHVPNGVNQLIDHEFRFGTSYWRGLANATGSVSVATNETLGIRRRTVTGSGVTVGNSIQLDSFPDRQRFACKAGDVIEASGFLAQSNCSLCRVSIQPYDAAGTALTASSFGDVTPGSSTGSISDFTRASVLYTMPANTAYAMIVFLGVASASAPVLHVARPMLARANSGQTVVSAWNPGFNGTPGADPTALNTAAAITGQGPGATAVAADVLNAYVPNGVNRLVDHDFRFGSTYWRALVPTGGGSVSTADAETAGVRRRTVTGSGITVGNSIQFDTYPDRARFACKAGDVVEASAYVSQSNCSLVRCYLQPYDAAGTALAISAFGDFTPGAGTSQLSDFTRVYKLHTMPANTAYCMMVLRGIASTSAPVLHVAKPMLAIANTSQTTPTQWNPGFNAVPGADITANGTAAAITGQGNLATSNLNRGATASRPTATGSGSLYANTTTGTVQMDTAAGVWTDIATLSTAVQPRGRILGPSAVNVSNTSTWNVVAQVDLTDIPASAVIQAPYVDAVGQSQDGVSIGAGWQWRLCEAPTSSPSTKTVLKTGNMSLTAGASLGGGAYDPPTVDSIDQPSAALVAATNSGAVRYTIEVQRTSGSAIVGIQMTANFIINPS